MVVKNKDIISTSILRNVDVVFGSKTSLDISMFSTTEDYVSYSPIKIKMSIFNSNGARSVNFDYSEVLDLFNTLNRVLRIIEQNKLDKDITITRVIGNGRISKFCFYRSDSDENICKITNYLNESNISHICNINKIKAVTQLFNNFINDYIKISASFVSNAISNRMMHDIGNLYDEIHNIKIATKFDLLTEEISSLKNYINQIDANKTIDKTEVIDNDNFIELSRSEDIILNLDIDKKIDTSSKLSTYIVDVLKNNIENLTIIGWMPSAGPDVTSMIEDQFYGNAKNIPSDFQLFYGLNVDSRKHLNYIMRRNIGRFHWFSNHGNTTIKSIFPVTYNPNTDKVADMLNIQIAYEALTLSVYYRCYVNNMNSLVADPVSMLEYCQQRQTTDPLWMPHLLHQDKKIIIKRLTSIFKDLNEIGFFEFTNSKLKNAGLKEVSDLDFMNAINEIYNFMINRKDFPDPYLPDLFRLSKNNNLTPFEAGVFAHVEQILDEDVIEHISIDEVMKKFSSPNDHLDYITDNIINEINKYNALATKLLNGDDIIMQPKNESNIIRFINDNPLINDDKTFKDSLILYFKRVGFNKVNFYDFIPRFTDSRIPDDIIAAMYIWNNDGMNLNYTNFKRAVLELKKSRAEIMAGENMNPAAFELSINSNKEEKDSNSDNDVFYTDVYDAFN